MPSAAALASILGPLLEIGPRVLLVMACGLLVLAAVRMSDVRSVSVARVRSSRPGRSGLSASVLPGSVLRASPSMAARRCRGACRIR